MGLWYVHIYLDKKKHFLAKISESKTPCEANMDFIKSNIFKIKNNAIERVEKINALSADQKGEKLLKQILLTTKPKPRFNTTTDSLVCRSCRVKIPITKNIEIDAITHRCLHLIISEKIDRIFQNIFLAYNCFNNGRVTFEGKKEDACLESLWGFSPRGHEKRTRQVFEELTESMIKNTYLMLGCAIEEWFYLLKKYKTDSETLVRVIRPNNFNFTDYHNSKNIRFSETAHVVRQISNLIKHEAGLFNSNADRKDVAYKLLRRFKSHENYIKDEDFIRHAGILKVENTQLSHIQKIIIRVYICLNDITADTCKLKEIRKKLNYQTIWESLSQYQVKESFDEYVKSINGEGFMLLE